MPYFEPRQVIPPGDASYANPQRASVEIFSAGEDGLDDGEATGVADTRGTDDEGVIDTRPTDDNEATELQEPNKGLQPFPQ